MLVKSILEIQKCLNRMIKHFKSKKVIAEKTLDELKLLRDYSKNT